VFACALAAAPCYASDWPEGTPAPEDTVKLIMDSYKAGDMTNVYAYYTTNTGRRVLN
jgi:hypothetical protein